jgi:hypothetical protein
MFRGAISAFPEPEVEFRLSFLAFPGHVFNFLMGPAVFPSPLFKFPQGLAAFLVSFLAFGEVLRRSAASGGGAELPHPGSAASGRPDLIRNPRGFLHPDRVPQPKGATHLGMTR